MSKIHDILTVIAGEHLMGATPLGDYHAAKAARDAGRIRDIPRRHSTIRRALHSYRVIVSYSGVPGDGVRIRSNTKAMQVYV